MPLDTLSIECPLVLWRGEKGRCNWCDKELTGRQQRWCSSLCSDAYGRNHWWGYASKAAKERDGWRCTRCGHAPTEFDEAKPTIGPAPELRPFAGDLDAWRRAMFEWRLPLKEWEDRKQAHRRRTQLEVHHIAAAEGAHNRPSCLHHLDNLVTLCHPCHLEAERERKREAWEARNQTALSL